MKLAISIEVGSDLRAPICPAFGRAPRFLVHDTATNVTSILVNDAAAGAHGAGTGAAALVVQSGAEAVVSGRFGPKAFEVLQAAGIEMYVTATDGSAATALERFLAGDLRKAVP